MELTVKELKNILEKLDDDVVLATLNTGNNDFYVFNNIKRLIVLKDTSISKQWEGKTFLTIQQMGANFSKTGYQAPLNYMGICFDEDGMHQKEEKIHHNEQK